MGSKGGDRASLGEDLEPLEGSLALNKSLIIA